MLGSKFNWKESKAMMVSLVLFTSMEARAMVMPSTSYAVDERKANDYSVVAKSSSMASGRKAEKKPSALHIPLRVCMDSKRHEIERLFRCFDEDGDGKLTPVELRNCMRTVGEELSAEDAEAAVECTDSDGDGLLGYDDFVKLVDSEGEEEKTRNLRAAFGVYEMEGQGFITPKSLNTILTRLGEPTTMEDCTKMINRFDLNGDGIISFEEFRIMMHSSC